jgi:Fe2+ transport system protein B
VATSLPTLAALLHNPKAGKSTIQNKMCKNNAATADFDAVAVAAAAFATSHHTMTTLHF